MVGMSTGKPTSSNRPRNTGVDRVARARARRRALQALYAWQLSGCTAREAVAQFAHEQAREVADLEYFEDLVFGVVREKDAIDKELRPFLDREVEEVDPIERAALRQATYELLHRLDVPYAVVINEAIEIVKKFGTEHGHTFVNGVLDHAAAKIRAVEIQAATSRRRD